MNRTEITTPRKRHIDYYEVRPNQTRTKQEPASGSKMVLRSNMSSFLVHLLTSVHHSSNIIPLRASEASLQHHIVSTDTTVHHLTSQQQNSQRQATESASTWLYHSSLAVRDVSHDSLFSVGTMVRVESDIPQASSCALRSLSAFSTLEPDLSKFRDFNTIVLYCV